MIAAVALFFLPAQEVPPLVISDTQVNITPGTTVVSAENSRIRYCVGNDTLCGVLSVLAEEEGLEFVIEDHAWNPRFHSQAIGSLAGYTAIDNATWNCTVKGVPVLLESAEDGLCSHKVNDSDEVCFFFGTPGQDASKAAAIVRTRVHLLSGQKVPAENWSLSLRGVSAATIDPEIYAEAMRCHGVAVTAPSGTVWSGVPVFFFVGVVDGEESPDHPMLSSRLASTGYTVTFTGQNNSTLALPSDAVIRNNSYILAYMKDDALLSVDQGCGPLALVDPGMEEVPFGGVTGITLSDFEQPPAPPEIRIVRYAADGTTPLNETTVNTTWMRENLPVLVNETVPYRFQGPTFNASDRWDPAEEKNLAKVEDAVLGTSIRDLCSVSAGCGLENVSG